MRKLLRLGALAPDLLTALAEEKLAGIAAGLRADGWHSVEVGSKAPPNLYDRGVMFPMERTPTPGEAEALAALDARIAELDDGEDYPELDDLSARRDDLAASLLCFSDEQKAADGVVLYVDYDGQPARRHCWAKAERRVTQPIAANDSGPNSAALVEDLTRIRTLALQEAVAHNPTLALDLLPNALRLKCSAAGAATAKP